MNELVTGSLLLLLVTSGTPDVVDRIARVRPEAVADPSWSNALGINVAGLQDYSRDRLYADVIRTARSFNRSGTNGNGPRVTVDAVGWPTSDTSFYVWHGIDNEPGAWALSFHGKANVTSNHGPIATTYDARTNTSRGVLHYGSGYLWLDFSRTQRIDGGPTDAGVTDIHLMRPGYPTATRITGLFTSTAKNLYSRFSVVRFVDYLGTNGNPQVHWSDRTPPSKPTMSDGTGTSGGPWEHVILLCNEAHLSPWITLPVAATDEYVRKVAQVFKYGSDGVNPYTSPQKSPVYPPLDASLPLYVEFSNEVWNFAPAFPQGHANRQAALAEVARGPTPLNYDGLVDPSGYVLGFRRIVTRGVQISLVFRSVFGDDAMMTRVRPVLMTQQGNGQNTFGEATSLLLEHYAGWRGGGPTPHPPSYYFYGAGGSAYYGPADKKDITLDQIFSGPFSGSMTPSGSGGAPGWNRTLRVDAAFAATLGLKRVAYEGGPSLDFVNGPSAPETDPDAVVKTAAVNDDRMTAAIVQNHDAWSAVGGNLLVYYKATGNAQWGFTPDAGIRATKKLAAIDTLRTRHRASITFGVPVGGTISGSDWSVANRGRGARNRFGPPWTDRLTWASYVFRADTPSSDAAVVLSKSGSGAAAVYVDGVERTSSDGGTTWRTGAIDAGLHAVIVRVTSGTFTLDSVAFR